LTVHAIYDNLSLIDLDLPVSRFTQFIGSWVMHEGDRALVVDPGPSASVNILFDSLRELGVDAEIWYEAIRMPKSSATPGLPAILPIRKGSGRDHWRYWATWQGHMASHLP